ncbi:RNA polymerase sigma factor [Paractinoplanes lichenicola]|uniref:RNA polymerase sigma factor n=1 Tax=Paractinoplanes lichenicola TaxID=2802976 RepID=A0ABS1VYQ6_9ACTN|nr:sigma factor-like helix-turn-helix DNA-binding protein [Actinoplanes lichenicola]MBL7259584.1 RNA polymerase sigma factor [Actinoplanes lichenicola]
METDIVAETRDDPPAAAEDFESFYASTSDRVYRALAVALGDVHLAREAADEAMARAFVRWRQVKVVDNPAGWVFRVGLNWATSWRRKLRRERAFPETEHGLPGFEPGLPDGDAEAALARLPIPTRAVVVCRVLFGLSTAETAAVLQIAEGTVRSRLSRAKSALRDSLEEKP